MIPKEIKALIDEHCMGIKDAGKISPEVMDLIMNYNRILRKVH